MKKTLALVVGLALVASALTVAAQSNQGRGRGGKGATSNTPCEVCKGAGTGKACQNCAYGAGQGQGQQKRYGWGKGQGQGKGQGKGFRGGACDGTGPKRDGSCGQCPKKS